MDQEEFDLIVKQVYYLHNKGEKRTNEEEEYMERLIREHIFDRWEEVKDVIYQMLARMPDEEKLWLYEKMKEME